MKFDNKKVPASKGGYFALHNGQIQYKLNFLFTKNSYWKIVSLINATYPYCLKVNKTLASGLKTFANLNRLIQGTPVVFSVISIVNL